MSGFALYTINGLLLCALVLYLLHVEKRDRNGSKE